MSEHAGRLNRLYFPLVPPRATPDQVNALAELMSQPLHGPEVLNALLAKAVTALPAGVQRGEPRPSAFLDPPQQRPQTNGEAARRMMPNDTRAPGDTLAQPGHRGTVLPLMSDPYTGRLRPAVPGVVRDLIVGGADLLDGMRTGVVTPEVTNALMGLGGIGPRGALTAGGSRRAAVAIPTAEDLARMAHPGYNPAVAITPDAPPRPFAADYPGRADVVSRVEGSAGAQGLHPGGAPPRLATDIEGRRLVAPTVIGRQVAGGPDVAFSTPERAARDIEALSQAITGAPSRVLPGGGPAGEANMGDALGRLWPTGRTMPAEAGEAAAWRPVYQVDVAKSVPEVLRPAVLAHEGVGHGIDLQARLLAKMDLDPPAVRQQMFWVYDELARRDPLRMDRVPTDAAEGVLGPEFFGYKPHQVGKELVVENLRAYFANPNWFKTVAPDVAAQMRGIVNTDPFVSRYIQLNSAGDPIVAAAGIAGAASVQQPARQDTFVPRPARPLREMPAHIRMNPWSPAYGQWLQDNAGDL